MKKPCILKLKREANAKSLPTSRPNFILEKASANQDKENNEHADPTGSVDLAKKLRAS
jgi:hypothetical protein